MAIQRQLTRLEKLSGSCDRETISAYSEDEMEKKIAEYKKKNPGAPEQKSIIIRRGIIVSKDKTIWPVQNQSNWIWTEKAGAIYTSY